jgi:hypothetical protein
MVELRAMKVSAARCKSLSLQINFLIFPISSVPNYNVKQSKKT